MIVFIEILEPLDSCGWGRGGVGLSLLKDVCTKFEDLYGGFGGGYVFV